MANLPHNNLLWPQREWAFEHRPADEAWPPADVDNSWLLQIHPQHPSSGDSHHHAHDLNTHSLSASDSRSQRPDLLEAILNNDSSALPTESARVQLEARSIRTAEPYPTSARDQRRPLARHQNDWLDRTAVEPQHAAQFPSHLIPNTSPGLSPQSPYSESSRPTDDDLEALVASSDSEEEAVDSQRATMPPPRQTNRNVVDLTAESPPMPAASATRDRKRAREADSSAEGGSEKRSRVAVDDIEEIDLAEDEMTAEEKVLQAQQREAIQAQRAGEDGGPHRIGQRQCVICMENFTNITATHCGHFYCHECLIRSLMAAEKTNERNTGNCPICRKTVSRANRAATKPHIIPISFMTKGAFERNKRRRMTHDDESYRHSRSRP